MATKLYQAGMQRFEKAMSPTCQSIFVLDPGKYSFLRQEFLPGIQDRNWLIPLSLAHIIVSIELNENTPYDLIEKIKRN